MILVAPLKTDLIRIQILLVQVVQVVEMKQGRENLEDLARTITIECGKTLAESRGELRRVIENVEVAAGIDHRGKAGALTDQYRAVLLEGRYRCYENLERHAGSPGSGQRAQHSSRDNRHEDGN